VPGPQFPHAGILVLRDFSEIAGGTVVEIAVPGAAEPVLAIVRADAPLRIVTDLPLGAVVAFVLGTDPATQLPLLTGAMPAA
jgi:hypothetical protein